MPWSLRRSMPYLLSLLLALGLLAAPGSATAAPITARDLLGQLTMAAEVRTGYDRDLFVHWSDADRDGCDTRREVLIAESLVPVTRTGTCTIVAGQWHSAYDGVTWTDPAGVQIDHMVPLAEAWDSGARTWDATTREAFANDLVIPESLRAVTGSVNGSKSDRDPAGWMPPLASFHCDYAIEWVTVKYRWNLSIDTAEKSALESTLSGDCGARAVLAPPRASVTTVTAPPAVVAPRSFTDVPRSHTWYTQIMWLAGTGVTTGYAERNGTYTFRSGQPVLREQMAAFMYRLAGSPSYAAPARSRFTDVSTRHTFYKEISWLYDRGVSTGYVERNGTRTFRPGQPVLREQMAAFLRRLEGSPSVTLPSSRPFTDVATSHTFYRDIVWLAASGISTGWDSGYGCRTYRPSTAVQRGDMAAFMYRLKNGGTAPVLNGNACRPPAPPAPGGPVAPISGTWNCPSHAPIKGNRNSMIYHVPGGSYYSRTKPEQCFRTEADAVRAGYRKSKV